MAASSTANEEQAETIQAGRAAVSRLQDALTARAQALQVSLQLYGSAAKSMKVLIWLTVSPEQVLSERMFR